MMFSAPTEAASPIGPGGLIGGTWRLVTMRTGDQTGYAPSGDLRHTIRLTGYVWQWIGTGSSKAATPVAIDPARYTVSFGADGSISVTADCNTGRSSFITNGDQIAIRAIALSRAMCPEGSLSGQFVAQLET